jgi:hypothetical protein
VTFARESFNVELIAEIKPLNEAHYQEIETFQDIQVNPDWPLYANAEGVGILRLFTARDEQQHLCGYAVFFVRAHPHCRGSIQATQDCLFLAPGMRKGWDGLRFIKWCDRQLRDEGVAVVYHHVKLCKDFGSALRRMGYSAIETVWAKRLDQWEE